MTLGGVVHPYGLLIGIGVLVALEIAKYQAKRCGESPEWLEQAVVWMFVPALIGARLYHIITDSALYIGQPLFTWVAVWNGGLGYLGGLIGAFLGLLVYVRSVSFPQKTRQGEKKHGSSTMQLLTLADLCAFGIPVGQAIGRVGNYFNQELYGLPTSLPWGIWIQGQRYHPLFAYEALLNLTVAIGLWGLGQRKALRVGKGQYFALYLVSYGTIRFWLEFLRIDSARLSGIAGIFTIAQWVALGMMGVGGILFWVRRHAIGVKHVKAWDFSLE